MKNSLAFVVGILGILAVAPNASQAQAFTLGFWDEPGYYAPGYYPPGFYRYPYYGNESYNPGHEVVSAFLCVGRFFFSGFLTEFLPVCARLRWLGGGVQTYP